MNLRVYYEDTDAAGVVYHANYLKFMERARTEFLRDCGLSVAALAASGMIFPVIRIEMDFKTPAIHDDLLSVRTAPVRIGNSSFALKQEVLRQADGKLLVEALVTLACVSPELKAKRIPAEVREVLSADLRNDG